MRGPVAFAGWVAALLATLFLTSEPARADVMLETNESVFTNAGGTVLDWGSLGPAGTSFAAPINNFPFTTSEGLNLLTILNGPGASDADFVRVNQDGSPFNFPAGTQMLFTPFSGSPSGRLDLRFGDPIAGYGGRLQADPTASPGGFVGTITAFDPLNNPLGTFPIAGGPGEAPFFGIISTATDIQNVVITVLFPDPETPFLLPFAFDPIVLPVPLGPAAVPTPEPSSVLLWGLSAVGLIGHRRVRWRRIRAA